MSYENENEIVLTIENFKEWCDTVNGNAASMKNSNCDSYGKPVYHLNETTGKKTEIKSYEYVFHPLKLDVTADEITNEFYELEKIVKENPEPNRTATARYFDRSGKCIITEHCVIVNA